MNNILLVLLLIGTMPFGFGQNTDIRPDLVSFPTKTTAGMNALTISDGLREGSTVYNSDFKTLAFFDGCQWQKVKKMPANMPVITNLAMRTALPPTPEVQLDWTHSGAAATAQYKIQRSINHGNWVTIATLNAPVTSYTVYNSGVHVNTGHYHTWRVVAVDNCGTEVPSCPQTTYFGFSTFDYSLPLLLKSPANFTVGSALEFDVTQGYVSGLEYFLEKYNGSGWNTVAQETITSQVFSVNGGSLVIDGIYRITLINTSNTALSNTIGFTYSPPKTCQDEC